MPLAPRPQDVHLGHVGFVDRTRPIRKPAPSVLDPAVLFAEWDGHPVHRVGHEPNVLPAHLAPRVHMPGLAVGTEIARVTERKVRPRDVEIRPRLRPTVRELWIIPREVLAFPGSEVAPREPRPPSGLRVERRQHADGVREWALRAEPADRVQIRAPAPLGLVPPAPSVRVGITTGQRVLDRDGEPEPERSRQATPGT